MWKCGLTRKKGTSMVGGTVNTADFQKKKEVRAIWTMQAKNTKSQG